MSFIGIKLPYEIARQLARIEVPGVSESPATLHVTMFYLGDDVTMDDVGKAAKATFEVVSQADPLGCRVSQVDTFEGDEESVPVICPVESPDLMELHGSVSKALDAAGVEYSKKWPEYKPHVTLSYCKPDERPASREIKPVEWTTAEVVLWAGDSYDDRMVVVIPTGSANKLAHKVASAYLRQVGSW